VRYEDHIQAGGIGKNLTFVMVAVADINGQIDAAYHTKYGPLWRTLYQPHGAP
jgi:hypothetical protein